VGCRLGAVVFHLAILAVEMAPAGILAAGMAVAGVSRRVGEEGSHVVSLPVTITILVVRMASAYPPNRAH
jgi:hypothetical protein